MHFCSTVSVDLAGQFPSRLPPAALQRTVYGMESFLQDYGTVDRRRGAPSHRPTHTYMHARHCCGTLPQASSYIHTCAPLPWHAATGLTINTHSRHCCGRCTCADNHHGLGMCLHVHDTTTRAHTGCDPGGAHAGTHRPRRRQDAAAICCTVTPNAVWRRGYVCRLVTTSLGLIIVQTLAPWPRGTNL